jgi:hypothetical protein
MGLCPKVCTAATIAITVLALTLPTFFWAPVLTTCTIVSPKAAILSPAEHAVVKDTSLLPKILHIVVMAADDVERAENFTESSSASF